jgi:hypothetical protein
MTTVINGSSPSITFSDSSVQNTSAIVSGYVPYANLPAGSVLQVVQTAYATQTSTTSSSFVDTGLTASITPKFSTSKILVTVSSYWQSYVTSGNARDSGGYYQIVRASTNIWTPNNVSNYIDGGVSATLSFNLVDMWSYSYLDSPATTSSTAYKLQQKAVGGCTVVINPGGVNAPSTITLMEIAA